MLDTIRRHSSSWLVKALFGLLILSFGIWGIGDVIRGGAGDQSVAMVGDVKIPPQRLDYEYRRELRRLQIQTGGQLTSEQAVAFGLPTQVLRQVISRTLFDIAAEDLGLAVSDGVVRQNIQNSPAFTNRFGSFDRAQFELVLSQNGLSESQYVNLLRQDILHRQITGSMEAGLTVPSGIVDQLYNHRHEKRIADMVTISDASMPEPAMPGDEVLTKYHQDHKDQFTAPEYRALTVASLEVDELAKEVAVSDDELRTAFDQRGGGQVIAAKRSIRQILVPDEEAAKAARQRLADGESFEAVAADVMDGSVDDFTFENITREELLPELAGAAFDTAEGGFSEPVKTGFGWHILQVTKVEPGRQLTFEEAKDDLTKELARDKALDNLFELSNRLEDALAGGATLEESARSIGARLFKIEAVDRVGRDPNGNAVADLLPDEKFLETAFSTGEGQDSALTERGTEGYFIVHVDSVTPSVLRPLSEVREQVINAWKADQRAEAAKQKAEELVNRLNGGADMAEVAAELGLEVTTSPAVNRYGIDAPQDMPQALISTLFDLNVGQAGSARATGGYRLAELKEIKSASASEEPGARDAVRKDLVDSLQGDIRAELQGALEEQHPVSVNQTILNQMF